MIVGTIDRVWSIPADDEKFVVGGWAYAKEGEQSLQVLIVYSGDDSLELKRVKRGDFPDDVNLGFEVEVDSAELFALLVGKLKISAIHESGSLILSIWAPCASKIRTLLLDRIYCKDSEVDSVRKGVSNLMATIRAKHRSTASLDYPSTLLRVREGSQSIDGDVIVGANGRVFLYSGTNRVQSQYENISDSEMMAAKWFDCLDRRDTHCRANGAKYLQVIVPEKQSVWVTNYPEGPASYTPLYERLVSSLTGRDFFVDIGRKFVAAASQNIDPFRKIDSHLSIDGLRIMVTEILSRLGYAVEFRFEDVFTTDSGGDLGSKFFINGEFVESVVVPAESFISGAGRSPNLVESIDVDGHIGTKRSWVCESAPFDEKVLIFGNSFFERGVDPLCLSFWFARLFKRVEFIWTPSFSYELISEMRPSLVIGQTIERFLVYLPQE